MFLQCALAVDYPDFAIKFSNIGGGTSALPTESNTISLTGKAVNGSAMVRLSDLAYLGATISVSSNTWYVTINGQTIVYTKDSTYFTTTTTYDLYDPSSGSTNSYAIFKYGYSSVAAQEINGTRYVQLTTAANQCGSLLVAYNSGTNTTLAYHFRVNSSSPYTDNNIYIVGGPWLTNWSSSSTTQLAPHFQISELWDDSDDANTSYELQLKMAASQLNCAERIRYYYNNASSMTLTSGFRGWDTNRSTTGSWAKSFHMRGRAWDASNTNSIYSDVYTEFCGSYSTPINNSTYGYWTTRVTNGNSAAYEIEKMPVNGVTWLHVMTQPAAAAGTC
ncbi:MAG: hypothetical protein GXY49_12600 [Syntrophomonadaceae bacterium]|nr:hypothetical protein [Syntrophomonadaceae bacterium]